MNYRYFRDKQISEIGFGCGGYWGLKTFSEKTAETLVRTAIEHGVTFFDTGSNYSYGNAEVRLGSILKQVDPYKLLIGTKAGTIMVKGKWQKDFSRDGIESSVTQSLKRLGLDYLPLLQLHSPSMKHINDDVFETLYHLKKEGIVRYIGVSSDGMILEKALDYDVDCIMPTYNIINQNQSVLFEKAKKKNVAILAKSPLAHGVYRKNLFAIKKPSDIWYLLRILKNYRNEFRQGRKFRFINDFEGWKGSEIALNYVLKNESVSCAVIGTTSINHLVHNINAANKLLPDEIVDIINNTTKN